MTEYEKYYREEFFKEIGVSRSCCVPHPMVEADFMNLDVSNILNVSNISNVILRNRSLMQGFHLSDVGSVISTSRSVVSSNPGRLKCRTSSKSHHCHYIETDNHELTNEFAKQCAFQTALHLAPRNQRIEKQIARRREWVEEVGHSFDQYLQYA